MKTVRRLLAFTLLPLFVLALAGCGQTDGLTQFLLVAGRGVETVESLDAVDSADIGANLVDDLAYETSFGITLLAAGDDLTNAEKIAEIRALRATMQTTHAAIAALRPEVRAAFESLREEVRAFRASAETLTAEERERVAELTTELRAINADLRDSIGTVYERMHALRGKYNIENLDLVLDTHREVSAILATRLMHLERVRAILAELSGMVAIPEA